MGIGLLLNFHSHFMYGISVCALNARYLLWEPRDYLKLDCFSVSCGNIHVLPGTGGQGCSPFSCGDILDKSMVDMMAWCAASDIQGPYFMETELPESD